MSRQIAVRLPEDIVEFVDSLVSDGAASSRAMVVKRALERERRRTIAARDSAILAQADHDPEMQRLAEHLTCEPLELE
ncbi:MAG: antitoxin [Actinobacteria bacterium]|nr:antitoxin [Actinomycetota bacterium]